ncbi:hypothetical protein N7499_007033 [Penicillium canescens]|uniref:Uncharacterized protein n=1 Tax=Penicillium canescens TaxID=5083 RepID=A0AAD6NA17_PENCN|nr:hypothetical protein N7522_008308 [Penicillium canescens]KAJ6044532.1 hypothetical protein N7460_005887 [Penicillium canescens]KAJ6082159.1 hypothetical protein N7499_007033 [Penicillium canescens]KAJ6176044.1 hypothetical protein N7485_002958 [Penicillium canescens]
MSFIHVVKTAMMPFGFPRLVSRKEALTRSWNRQLRQFEMPRNGGPSGENMLLIWELKPLHM